MNKNETNDWKLVVSGFWSITLFSVNFEIWNMWLHSENKLLASSAVMLEVNE